MKKGKGKHNKKRKVGTKLSAEEIINPFELKINKQKHHVLGQKSKHDRGKPGISRSKINKKRLELFKKKEQLTRKSNSFVDKRIGEYDDSATNDDLVIARIIQARSKKYKKNVFNLNDDEELTHLGRPLSEFEKSDKPLSDSDDEDDAQLNADFVNDAHFGGFLTKKNEGESLKTHREIIDDIIVESKRKKQEKKADKEMNDELTDKLNKEWEEMKLIVSSLKRTNEDDNKDKKTQSDASYDMTFQQLKFEPRATAPCNLQTEEQKRIAEERKLKNLEEQRQFRMNPEEAYRKQTQASNELSADSIYDNLDIDDNFQSQNTSMGDDDVIFPFKNFEGNTSAANDNESDENTDEFEEDGNDDDEDGSASDEDDEDGSASDEDENAPDNEDSIIEEDEDNDSISYDVEKGIDVQKDSITHMDTSIDMDKVDAPKSLEEKRGNFSCPQSLEEFLIIIKAKTENEVPSIVGSIIENNHPRLRAENKIKLETFFTVLVEYLCKISVDSFDLQFLNSLVPHLYNLAQLSPVKTGLDFQKILVRKGSLNLKMKASSCCPSFDFLVLLKLVSILYPTSDFRHPVVTPAFLFLSDILTSAYKITYYNLVSRLFLSHLFFEYVSYSKRLASEPISALFDILYLCSRLSPSLTYSPVHKTFKKNREFLLTDSVCSSEPQIISLSILSKLEAIEDTNDLKVSIVNCAVKQLMKFANLYTDESIFSDLFMPYVTLSNHLPVEMYPHILSSSVQELKALIVENCKLRNYLKFPYKKPPMLQMLEPNLESSKRSKVQDTPARKLKIEKELSKKIKKEERGIAREIRRETQFVASEQLKARIAADDERKMKVKKLCRELAEQECDFKKITKKKKN